MELPKTMFLKEMIPYAEFWKKEAAKNKRGAEDLTEIADLVFLAQQKAKEAGQTIEEYDN